MLGDVRDMKFDRALGILYIVAQCVGALLGALFSTIFASAVKDPISLAVKGDDMLQSAILETMGSFFLVFMYLSSTEPKTKFTNDKAI